MHTEYPNLPLVEERFQNTPHLRKAVEEYKKKTDSKYFIPEYDCVVFPQTFPNTAGIFEKGGLSGQAFTKQYITVISEQNTQVYGVFGGDYLAYIVEDPKEVFFEDIDRKDMAVLRKAISRY